MWIKGVDPVSEVTEDWISDDIEVIAEICPDGNIFRSICQVLRMPEGIVQCHWLTSPELARKYYPSIKDLLAKHDITHVSFIH